jgi:hypothetical protein
MTARDRYREAVAETLTDWRLGVPAYRMIPKEVVQEGLREIIRLRLWIAYMPLLQSLERIEKRCAVLANLRADPYAPPPKS